MAEARIKHPWLIHMHYRMRAASFALLFVATGLNAPDQGYGATGWLLLAALFLAYPQLQHWRTRRAADSYGAEMHNLLIDSALLGIYIAGVGFSLWLAFSAMLGTLSNNAANRGWRGVSESIAASLAGVVAWIAVGELHFSPHTEWSATLFCIGGLGWYVLAMNNVGYARNLQLRTSREALKLREKELLAANLALIRNLREIDELQVQLRDQATRDPLTGLYNRGYLDSTLEREAARCKRDGESFSLVMIDVDHFKHYNDRYGHQAGDECLKMIAGALQGCARRASDMVARYGGEEFSLVLPDTDAAAAQALGENLRRSVEALGLPHPDSPAGTITISVGIAAMRQGAYKNTSSLLRAADQALYRAKEGGRNQVQVAPERPQAIGVGESALANLVQPVWLMNYECNHAVLDEQHRTLFEHANRLLAAILSGYPADDVATILDTLIDAVARHFRDEEQIISAAGFPRATEHAAGHQALLARAGEMLAEFRDGMTGAGELFRFVAQDLISHHMLGSDREFAAHVGARLADGAQAPAAGT